MSQNLFKFELGEFNDFIINDYKLISLILTGTIEGDDLDKFSVDSEIWGKYISDLINDELLFEISMIKKMNKKQRLLYLKNDLNEYKNHFKSEIKLLIETKKQHWCDSKFELIMGMLNEFINLDFKNQNTFVIYKSIIDINNYLDEEKDNISDEEYLNNCNANLRIIKYIKQFCNYYLKHKLTSFAIKNFNSP